MLPPSVINYLYYLYHVHCMKIQQNLELAAMHEKQFESRLNQPSVWLVLFVFFAALPLFIYFSSYSEFLDESFARNRNSTIKYFHRELISFGNRATNSQIFLRQLQGFRDAYRRNFPDSGKNRNLIDTIFQEMPPTASLICWDNRGRIDQSLTRLKSSEVTSEQCQRFIELLLNAQNDFSTGSNLQTLHQIKLFEKQNSDFMAEITPLTGRSFQMSQAFTSPNQMFGSYLSTADVFFYWDYFNTRDNLQGGFASFIPIKDLPVTFGLSQILHSYPGSNPEFANGFFDITTGEIQLSYPQLLPVAKEIIEKFKESTSNPFFMDDWVIFVQPLAESTSVSIFSLFSTRSQKESLANEKKTAIIVTIIILVMMGFFFYHYYKETQIKGLSIRKKMGALFFLCMQLPISILIYLGLSFSFSQEKLLSYEADSQLTELVKKVDNNAQEFYRNTNEWLKSLKNLNEIKKLNKSELHRKFFEFTRGNQLKSYYLVGLDGEVVFDIDNSSAQESSNRLFIKRLGMRILSLDSGSGNQSSTNDTVFAEGLFDIITSKTGNMHQLIWPGTNQQSFIFSDVIMTDDGQKLASIAILDKTELDYNYLRQAVTNQFKIDPNKEIMVLKEDDISETIPKISTTFKANLLPMITTARISNNIETDRVMDENGMMLVALGRGINVSDFIIGSRYNWHKIMETIHMTYFLVGIGLFFSLSASLFLITIMIREFLTPVSILSSGASAIISGNLETNLKVFAKDELGELSATFNFMTRKLRNRMTELTVLYNLTQKASTTHSQREVFDLAASNLQQHLHSESCGTVWLNEGEGDDGLYLAEHLPEKEAAAIRSCARIAIRSFQIALEFSEAIDRHILAMPLYFEDKKFGAIYLIFAADRLKEKQGLSEDERSFIETLRHHLSLIIEKQRLFEQAITDGLTKLYLRRFFLATLEKEINRSKRYQLDVSVLLLDIDKFKNFNDTFGHQAGDYVLRETAQRIIESIRSVDTPGRYGGEEMAVILPQTNIKEAFIVAERIRKAIEGSEYSFKKDKMKVTASIGVSSLHNRDISVEEIIEEADKALYTAKDKGRNQVRIAPEAM